MARVKPGAQEQSNDELVAALRELLDLQSKVITEQEQEIAALKRAAANRDRRDRRRDSA